MSRALLILVVVVAAMNIAAGARRPVVEHRILSANHYPEAAAAAEAIKQKVPPGQRLAVVTYANDMLGELDCAIWLDYRLKWLLYPRQFDLYQIDPAKDLIPRPLYSAPAWKTASPPYAVFFRVTAPLAFPFNAGNDRAQGKMFRLMFRSGPPGH